MTAATPTRGWLFDDVAIADCLRGSTVDDDWMGLGMVWSELCRVGAQEGIGQILGDWMEVPGLGQCPSYSTRSSGDFNSSHLVEQPKAIETSRSSVEALEASAMLMVCVNYYKLGRV